MATYVVYLHDPRALLCLEVAENLEKQIYIIRKILENFLHAVGISIYWELIREILY